MNQTIVPTMDEIEAEYKNRQAALIRPASQPLSHTPPRSPVKVAQAELILARSKWLLWKPKLSSLD